MQITFRFRGQEETCAFLMDDVHVMIQDGDLVLVTHGEKGFIARHFHYGNCYEIDPDFADKYGVEMDKADRIIINSI